jgi:signal transduction histidine kinase
MTGAQPGEAELRAVQRRANSVAAFVALSVVAMVLVALSYWTDVVPDDWHAAWSFIGWRFAFVIVTVGLVTYTIEREHSYRRFMSQLMYEHERLSQTDQARSDIVASLTHELKTPLTSLLGYASLLRTRALEEPQREQYLAVMEEQGQRILHLIEELLQSSRLEAGVGQLQRAPLDLARLVRAVCNELATARARSVAVEVPDGDLGLFGDPTAIEHVITNLVDNAFKYSDPSSVVRATVSERDVFVLFSVEDDGVGIEESEIPHIFERFRQTPNARGGGSVGLGLYIVKNLVEAHGGRVWAESVLGKGTKLNVALPRRRR